MHVSNLKLNHVAGPGYKPRPMHEHSSNCLRPMCTALSHQNKATQQKPDRLQYHKLARSLHSSSSHQLSVPCHNLSFGSRAFRFSAPRVWNSLPVSIHISPVSDLKLSYVAGPGFEPSSNCLRPMRTVLSHQNRATQKKTDLLQYREPTRSLCSSNSHQLSVPCHNLSFESCAFRFSAPRVLNSLPVSIRESQSLRTFRRHLKTFYFQSAYPISTAHLA